MARFYDCNKFGPLGLKDYGSAMLCCEIWSLPFLGLRRGGGHGGAIWQPCPWFERLHFFTRYWWCSSRDRRQPFFSALRPAVDSDLRSLTWSDPQPWSSSVISSATTQRSWEKVHCGRKWSSVIKSGGVLQKRTAGNNKVYFWMASLHR